jgi:hypothetical protein
MFTENRMPKNSNIFYTYINTLTKFEFLRLKESLSLRRSESFLSVTKRRIVETGTNNCSIHSKFYA